MIQLNTQRLKYIDLFFLHIQYVHALIVNNFIQMAMGQSKEPAIELMKNATCVAIRLCPRRGLAQNEIINLK